MNELAAFCPHRDWELPRERESISARRSHLNGQSPDGDGRLRRVLTYLRARIATSNQFPLTVLAEVAGLSASRFQHVFRQDFGVAVRPYIRWLRLQRAACDLIAGADLSQAAHAAGFSDAAHMSRTFRSTLGVSPSDISRRVHVDLGLWHPRTLSDRVDSVPPSTHSSRMSDAQPLV
jgi:transcriptional regulator GlxA family with amidase domain